jgi:hypothetical protein
LPKDYSLTSYDIICGRSKVRFGHWGNRRFRVTISIFCKRTRTSLTESIDPSCLSE